MSTHLDFVLVISINLLHVISASADLKATSVFFYVMGGEVGQAQVVTGFCLFFWAPYKQVDLAVFLFNSFIVANVTDLPMMDYPGQVQSTMHMGQRQSTIHMGQRQSAMHMGQRPSAMHMGQRQSTIHMGQRQSNMQMRLAAPGKHTL